jgi:hypothetical protein
MDEKADFCPKTRVKKRRTLVFGFQQNAREASFPA